MIETGGSIVVNEAKSIIILPFELLNLLLTLLLIIPNVQDLILLVSLSSPDIRPVELGIKHILFSWPR